MICLAIGSGSSLSELFLTVFFGAGEGGAGDNFTELSYLWLFLCAILQAELRYKEGAMTIPDLQFPASAKEKWVEYLTTINENPYADYEKLGPELARQMIEILTETADHSPREDEKFYAIALLKEIEAQKDKKGSKAFVIRNFPIDDVTGIATPTVYNDFGTNGKGYLSEYSHLALMTAIGVKPITDPLISGGGVFQHITPRKGRENDRGNAGSKEDFFVHTERSFDAVPPKALALLGIRNWTQTPTHLFHLDKALNYLSEKEIDLLHEDQFIFPCGDALNGGSKRHAGPVITQVDGVNEYRIKLDAMLGKTAEATAVIKKLTTIFSHPNQYLGLRGSVVITPGVMFTFDNRTFGHGRPAIAGEKAPASVLQPKLGEERWLQRMTTMSEQQLKMG